jgi:alpha-mannosidase
MELGISLHDLDPEWFASLATADPWTSHLACRWAWPDGASTLRRTSLMAIVATKSDRPETPDAIEILSRERKTTLLFGGLAHHKRHGERMLDTLLIAGRETGRRFELGVALDLEHAFHAAVDFIAPTRVIATKTGPPLAGPTGWLLHVESAAVHVPRVEYLERTGDGRGWGLAVYLVETSGRAIRSRLRLFKNPIDARQTDFAGELVIDLAIDGDAVPFDLTPHEMVRVEVRLG